MLTCYCNDGDLDWWYVARPVTTLYAKRWRKCCSCKDRINVGDECMPLTRWRTPNPGSVAERIYNDEEPLATWYLCDICAGLYESLDSLGFCINMPTDMRELCNEYAQMQRDAGVFRGRMVLTPNVGIEPPKVGSNDGLGVNGGEPRHGTNNRRPGA